MSNILLTKKELEAERDNILKLPDFLMTESLARQLEKIENQLKEIEIERQEPIGIEAPEPIEIEPRKEIEIEYPDKVKVNARKEIVLKSRQLPKNNKDGNGNYDSVKLPSQLKDPIAWKKARAERLGASDISKFTSYQKDLQAFFKERFHGIEREFSEYQIESMEAGHFFEDRAHLRMAKELALKGKAELGDFKFSQIYLSKNRQYFSKDLPKLGAQLDAWGILDNKKAIIEIKSTNQFTFEALKNSLDLKDFDWGNVPTVQELLQESAPYYFYQIQAQMLATGITQAVLHVINRNNFETLSVHVKADLEAFAWIEKIVKRYEEIEGTYPSLPAERIYEDFKESSLGFNLTFPCPQAKEKKNEAIKARVFLKASGDPFILENLGKRLELEKEIKTIDSKLTRHGFKDKDRKDYKKFFSEGVAS